MSDAHFSSADGIEDIWLRLDRRYKAPVFIESTRCLTVTLPDDYQFLVAFKELVSRLGFEQVWDTDAGTMQAWELAALGSAIVIEDCVVSDGVPVGATMYWWGGLPDKYLDLSGQALNTVDYPELFAILGYNYGGSAGVFNLPNAGGRVFVDNQGGHPLFAGLGNTGGEETHTLIDAEMPSHTHTIEMTGTSGAGSNRLLRGAPGAVTTATLATGGDQAHNNLQPYIVARAIIKALP